MNKSNTHQAFVTDGCSMFPDGDWRSCCVEHDRDYWWGGTAMAREASDKRLKQCVQDRGYPIVANIMYAGVRIGGVPVFPMPWRWGFGLPYGSCPTYQKQVQFLNK